MIRLYGTMLSRATRPIWVLYETGAEFEMIPVLQAYRLADPTAPDAVLNTRSPEFLQINPQGQVPVMVHEGVTLTESLAIAWYVARLGAGDLAPKTLQDEMQTLQWALVGATSIEDTGLRLTRALTGPNAGAALASPEVQADLAALRRPFALIEAALEDRDYLLGAQFSLADILLAECCRYAQPASGLFAEFPRLQAWITRCQARPAFQKILAQRKAEAG